MRIKKHIKQELPHRKTSLPVVGNVRIGDRDPTKGNPRSLDYFVGRGQYSDLFNSALGDKPQKIQICFASNNVDECLTEQIEFRNNDGLWARGDGENWKVYNPDSRKYVDKSVDINSMREFCINKKRCTESQILTMYFVIVKIRDVMGVWRLQTKAARSSIPAMLECVDTVASWSNGVLQGVPFDLSVRKHRSDAPETGFKRVYPVLSLVCNISPENIANMERLKESGEKFKLLTNHEIESNERRQIAERN